MASKNFSATNVNNGGSVLRNDEMIQNALNKQMSGRSSRIASAERSGGALDRGEGIVAHNLGTGTQEASEIIAQSPTLQNLSTEYEAGTGSSSRIDDYINSIIGSPYASNGNSNSNPTFDNSAYQNALAQAISAYQNAGQNKLDALTKNYNAGVGNLQNAYNQKADALRQNNDDALRQAYINYMMGIKNLSQDLSNAGINGGAAESLLANMYNNYGNNRASIQNQTRGNLADLAANFNEGMANLTSGYNNNYADALNDMYARIAGIQADYANDEANRNYQTQLANIKAGNPATAEATSGGYATLDKNAYERAMGTLQNLYASGNYQKMVNYLDNLGIDPTVASNLLYESAGISPEELYTALNYTPNIVSSRRNPVDINPNLDIFRSITGNRN